MRKMNQKIEAAVYEQVAQEVERNEFQLGLMAKATARANGDRNLAQSLYIQYRVEQILKDLDDAAQKKQTTAEELKQQSILLAKVESHRNHKEKLQRALPRIKFIFCWIVITFIYWVGSSLRIPHWPGFVNIPTSELVLTFLNAAIVPMIIAYALWILISLAIRLVVWLRKNTKNKEQNQKTFFFFPILIISFILIFLDVTGNLRFLTAINYGRDGINDLNISGPWHISAETFSNYKISKNQSNNRNNK